MSVFWGRNLDSWEPQGGEQREWKDLAPGDLIAARRKIWRVIEVRPVPVADWDEDDQRYWDRAFGHRENSLAIRRVCPESKEAWDRRPLYLALRPAGGGRRRDIRIRPYVTYRDAYVLSLHYPVCKDCGEPWPCPELDIQREIGHQNAEMERLEKILPGCCWSCGEPVTHRQTAIRFDGENLLLPGAFPAVFHLRRKGNCLSDAMGYEKRWIEAAEGRRWRLQCPGALTRHVDGDECTEDPLCPGAKARHNTFTCHSYGRLPDGSFRSVYGSDFRCLRCEDALDQRSLSLGEPPPGALL